MWVIRGTRCSDRELDATEPSAGCTLPRVTQMASAPFDADDLSTVLLTGSLDGEAGRRLGMQLAERFAHGGCPEVRIDLSGVDGIDAAGVVALVRARQEVVASGRSFRLLDPSHVVGPILSLGGLDVEFTR